MIVEIVKLRMGMTLSKISFRYRLAAVTAPTEFDPIFLAGEAGTFQLGTVNSLIPLVKLKYGTAPEMIKRHPSCLAI